MRRYLILSLAALMMLALVACNNESSPPSQPEPENPSSEPSEVMPPLADVALYRGKISIIQSGNDELFVTLTQVEGTNFGAEGLVVRIGSEVGTNFELSDLAVGDYLEIQYGRDLSGDDPDVSEALIAWLLPPAEDCIINGTLKEMTYETDTAGVMVIEPIGDASGYPVSIEFNDNGFTQFYLTVSDLQEGDTLNIYTDGEGYALEVRRYTPN